MSVTANNPILPGFYPDPSILAVDGDYYIVNSTFSYFPGLSVMHSKDLAHWEQIGNVMTRESQLPLPESGSSRGLFAPTIRYHDGTYYVICTNVTEGGNFIVTSDRPEGPYSEPHYLKEADGIDPSLFFDDDGKCYYIGTHGDPENERFWGDNALYIAEVDLEKFEFKGEVHNVWKSAIRDIPWSEGPHLYKVGEYYYILYAEGGTGPEHSVCVVRSKNIFGPYENNLCNPIFTHRHLGMRYPIRYVGHADLVKTPKDEWYMVMLAVRPAGGFTTMGRETFLARVVWEKDWPVVNPGLGMLSAKLTVDADEFVPESPATSLPGIDKLYDLTKMENFGPEWLMLRNPKDNMYEFRDGEGLYLTCFNEPVWGFGKPSYAAIRQDCHCFEAVATLKGDGLFDGASAGLCLFQSEDYQLRLEYSGVSVNMILRKEGKDEKLASAMVPQGIITLGLQVFGTKAVAFTVKDNQPLVLANAVDISSLSTEVAGGFVGCTVGMFAQDIEEREEPVKALFKSFSYKRITKDPEKGEEK
ncbi:MAG: glycoside hydrolase family 43 protein [Lachnospiraceae bacterium]|nr:glycoside hydrolase family 43 protein [Lachnospiraceae bacterium]